MSSTRLPLAHVEDAIQRTLGVPFPQRAIAGGTLLFVALLDDGRSVTVGDLGGPFNPYRFPRSDGQWVVAPEGFTVEVYRNEEERLNGEAPLASGSITSTSLLALADFLSDAARKAREPRSYCIGLPVTITVYGDGTVAHEVDLSEADDIDEGVPEGEDGYPIYTDDQVEEDAQAIRDFLAREHGVI